MPNYEVDYTYKIAETAATTIEADNIEQAEQFTREWVIDTFYPCFDVEIDAVREVKATT